jgi:hypothetical protein
MTKFASDEDEGYLSVSTEIMRWVRAIQNAPKESKPEQANPPIPRPIDVPESPQPPEINIGWLDQHQQAMTPTNVQRGSPASMPLPYQQPPYSSPSQYVQQFPQDSYPQQPYYQQQFHQGMPQKPGYSPQVQGQTSPQPQQGNSTYNNYGGKQTVGNTFHGNVSF